MAKKFGIMALLTLGWMIVLAPLFLYKLNGVLRSAGEGGYFSIGNLNTYTLRSDAGEGGVVIYGKSDSDVYIGPGVDGYRIMSGLVIGHVSCSIYGGQCEPGYFILDTKYDKVQQGMSKNKWLKVLRENGIANEPRLIRPSAEDADR